MERALDQLFEQIHVDVMWKDFVDEQAVEYIRKSMDRALMAQVYGCALYPNGEADIYRDE